MNIGKAIRLCRTQRGLTQAELSRHANISTAYLSLLEQNKRDATVSVLESIAHGLEVPLNIVIFLAADKTELVGLNADIREKLSQATLELLKEPSSGFLL